MGFTHLPTILKTRRRTLLAVWGGVTLLALLFSLLLPREYLATVEVLVTPGAGDTLATCADIVASERVGGRAVAALALASQPGWAERWRQASGGQGDADRWIASQLRKTVEVGASPGSNVLRITVAADEPRFAAAYANALARAYLETDLELRAEQARQSAVWFNAHTSLLRSPLEDGRPPEAKRDEPGTRLREVEGAQQAYALALARLTGNSLEGASRPGSAALLSSAVVPIEAAGPKLLLSLALAIVIGGLSGVVTTLVQERLDRRIRGTDELAEALGAPVLARVGSGAADAPQRQT